MPAYRLSAGWVVPVEGPPIADAAVLIDPDGRIARVGPEAEVPMPSDVPARRFPEAAIIPGLVNVHTHLELTGFAGQVQDAEFAVWIRRLRELKERRGPDEYRAAARQGVVDCWAAGITTVADTGDSGAAIQALAAEGGSGIAYQEVFGPHPDQVEASMAGLETRITQLRRFESDRVRLGVSPHAPYTVSGALYRAAARWARGQGLPLAVHLAESPAEVELLGAAAGPFAEAWRRRGIPLPSEPGCSPVAWLEAHDVLGTETLCIHTVQVEPSDIVRLARAGCAIAHCPISNRRHGHGAAPLASLLAAGLRVGIGTDSVASVGQLDLFAEARAARELAALSAEVALELVTLAGARALGLETAIGSLRSGKWADLTVVRLGSDIRAAPVERLLRSNANDVVATFLGGRQVYGRTNG